MYERAQRLAEGTSAPKTFIRGQALLRTRKVVLTAGSIYAAASVLGQVTLGAAGSSVKASGANTGNGTFVLDPTTPILAKAQAGTYALRCITAAANGGTFRLEDPNGVVLDDFALPGTANGNVPVAEQIKGTLTDSAVDFVVGDGFDITIGAAALVNGLYKAKLATAAATDGTATPSLILAYDVDATAGDIEAIAYESGDFVKEQLVLGAGLTLDGIRHDLRIRNITFG